MFGKKYKKIAIALSAIFAAGALWSYPKTPEIGDLPQGISLTKDFTNAACDYDAVKGDLSKKDLKAGKILPPSCYQDAVYHGRENALIAIERGFIVNQTDPAEAQRIRNEMFLYLLDVFPTIEKIDLALAYGADINARTKTGQSAGALIYQQAGAAPTSYGRWNLLHHLHKKYHYDISFLADKPDFVWDTVIAAQLPAQEKEVINFLEDVRDIFAIDLEKALHDPITGINVLHIAAKTGSNALFAFIQDSPLQFSAWDKRGYHLRDYAAPEFAPVLVKNAHLYDQNENSLSLRPPGALIRDYLKMHSAADYIDYVKGAEKLIRPTSDFKDYHPIIYDRQLINDNHMDPALIIGEHSITSAADKSHIEDTSRVALGVSRALGSPGWRDVVTVAQNPKAHYDNHLSFLLKYNPEHYIIVSHSIGQDAYEDANKEYATSYAGYSLRYLDELDQKNFIYYNSAGNEGTDVCLALNGVSFCMQNGPASYHPITAVRVGAVERRGNDALVIPDYSNMRPTFCAELPAEKGRVYAGTSFSAPAAAAVEERLADIFGRSAALPNGVIHEDILMALILTAQAHGLIDEISNDIDPVFLNSAGLEMNNRCGAGVIQEQAAADLLAQMVKWTRAQDNIHPSVANTVRLELDDAHKMIKSGRYIFTLKVPHDGILTQLRAAIPFNSDNKGAALIQIGDQPPLPLDLANSGLSTEFRFAGHQFKAGDEIKLILTRPLQKTNFYTKIKGFLDLRMVQSNSPVALAIQKHNKPALTQ